MDNLDETVKGDMCFGDDAEAPYEPVKDGSVMAAMEKARREAESYLGDPGACSEEIVNLAEQFMELYHKSDVEVERVKACEHIAVGDDGWETLRNECPSTAAVAGLRDAYDVAVRALREIATHWALDYDHKYANTEQYRGSYGVGVTDGHRLAAAIARRGLGKEA